MGDSPALRRWGVSALAPGAWRRAPEPRACQRRGRTPVTPAPAEASQEHRLHGLARPRSAGGPLNSDFGLEGPGRDPCPGRGLGRRSPLWDPIPRLGAGSSVFGVAGDAGCAGAEFPLPQAGYTPAGSGSAQGSRGQRGGARGEAGGEPHPGSAGSLPSPAGLGVWSREPTVASSFAPRSQELSNARSLFPRDVYPAVRPSLPQAVWPPGILPGSPRPRDSVRGPLSAPLVAGAEPRWAACGTTTR